MPTQNAANSTVCASAVAATTWSPRRPSSIKSVVIMAIWPSCVRAIGHDKRSVSMISARQRLSCAGCPMPAAISVGRNVMAAT